MRCCTLGSHATRWLHTASRPRPPTGPVRSSTHHAADWCEEGFEHLPSGAPGCALADSRLIWETSSSSSSRGGSGLRRATRPLRMQPGGDGQAAAKCRTEQGRGQAGQAACWSDSRRKHERIGHEGRPGLVRVGCLPEAAVPGLLGKHLLPRRHVPPACALVHHFHRRPMRRPGIRRAPRQHGDVCLLPPSSKGMLGDRPAPAGRWLMQAASGRRRGRPPRATSGRATG